MKMRFIILLLLLFTVNGILNAQNAPVTTAGYVYAHGPDVTVPVKVSNFVDIGSISLTFDYNPSIVQITGITVHPTLETGFMADWTTIPGRIVMGWYGTLSGVTLPDTTHLADIHFTGLVGGETDLVWLNNGNSCEYAKFNGGNLIVLNQDPFSSYYINGKIKFWRGAPVTIAPFITGTPNTTLCIPITVREFENIGAISLTLDYLPSVLTYQSVYSTNIPWGNFSGAVTTPGRLVVGCYGPAIASLPYDAVLFYACFTYHGGTSPLTWYDSNGSACEYADGTTLEPLADIPTDQFYINGLVTETMHADFQANILNPARDACVSFTDLSTGGPTSWHWSFDRPEAVYMAGSTDQSQNPQVKFTMGGPYTVTLLITNLYTNDTEIKTQYIWAGTPGIWTGESSTDWFNLYNWDDWRIPSNTIDVIIPLAPRYPVYENQTTNTFRVGEQCHSITVNHDANITIEGDFVNDL